MIYVEPGDTFTITAVYGEAGLADVGYTIYNAATGVEAVARSTDVTEVGDDGVYTATPTAPMTEATYLAIFDQGGEAAIVIDFTVTANVPQLDTVPAATVARIRERVETDTDDEELNRIAAEAVFELNQRYGAEALARTEYIDGGARSFRLSAPADPEATLTVYEDDEITSADDYRVIHDGLTVERLTGVFASNTYVIYTPVDNSATRQEVVIKLVMLTLEYRGGMRYDRVGDAANGYAIYADEREALLRLAAPRAYRMV